MQKRYTITQLLSIFIVLLIIVQSVIYFSMFHQFGVEKNLKTNDISAFYNNLHARSKFLDSLFNEQWSNLNYVNTISDSAIKFYNGDYSINEEEKKNVETDLLFSLITMNENLRVNGSFVILENEDSKELESFMIMDSNPLIQSGDLSDLMLEIGSREIANEFGLSLSSEWTPKLDTKEDNDLNRLFHMLKANSYRNLFSPTKLGYWSEFTLHGDVPDAISYCIPITTKENNRFCGVVGLIIEKDYLINNMFKSMYFDNQTNSFSIARRIRHSEVTSDVLLKANANLKTDNSIFFKNIVTNGDTNNIIFNDEIGIYERKFEDGNNKIYSVMSLDEAQNITGTPNTLAIFTPIKLYGANSSYVGYDWYLINYVHYDDLFMPTHNIINNLYTPIGINILAEIIFFVIMSSMALKELNLLLTNIKILAKNPNNKLLYNSKIYEVDQIFKTIQNLNAEIVNFSSKMEQILESTDIKIGAVEVFKSNKDVIITGSTAFILGFEEEFKDSLFVSRNYFNEKFQNFISTSRIFDSKTNPDSNKITITYEISTEFYHRASGYPVYEANDVRYITVSKIQKENRILYIIVDETEKIKNIIKIRFERDHDSLTGLLNGKAFREKVAQTIDNGIVNGAMIMWDLDNLKYINDNYGHSAGDSYIKETAKILGKVKFKNYIVARIAGDEFYAFVYNFVSEDLVLKSLEDLKDNLNSTVLYLNNHEIRIKASTGISWYKKDSNDVATLIKYADFAMYHAKKSQKGTIREFDISKYNSDFILSNNHEYINRFIENKELKYAFQPIVDVKTTEILGYEAFMRPTSGNIKSPYGVLRMAKSQAKLDSIEKMTWLNAIEEYSLRSKGNEGKKLFINSFSNISISNEDEEYLCSNFSHIIKNVVMEIIDHEHMNLPEIIDENKFKNMWCCKVSFDDFGEDYQSHIVSICSNSNYMKIDMSIVRNIDANVQRQNIFKKLVAIAHEQDIRVIAEGIETYNELKTVVELGTDYAQGFFIGFPDFNIGDLSVEKRRILKKIAEDKE